MIIIEQIQESMIQLCGIYWVMLEFYPLMMMVISMINDGGSKIEDVFLQEKHVFNINIHNKKLLEKRNHQPGKSLLVWVSHMDI